MDLAFIKSENNPADVMTKNVSEQLFLKHSKNILGGKVDCWREDDVKSSQVGLSVNRQSDADGLERSDLLSNNQTKKEPGGTKIASNQTSNW